MKKTVLAVILATFVLFCFVACSAREEKIPENPDGKAETFDVDENTADGQNDGESQGETAEQQTAEQPTEPVNVYAVANSLIDRPVSELYAQVGEPDDKSYASSCIGDGQDGELYYGDVVVVTYVEGENETIVDVYR